jgi:trans-2,3-dihydro-3-hydroxyanthranilate isomerase
MSETYEFVQLDVFTQTPLTGNPLAVFTDARGLDDNEMQALAREMNLSETTFILPRDPATEAQEGKKVRIFTVAEELPFAGHPTLGTALHLYATQAAPVSEQSDQITLDLKAGKIPVRFTANSKNAGRNLADGQVFGEMRQRDPEFGVTFPREEVARVLGIAADEFPWPIQSVSTGLPFVIVAIRNPETLANLKFPHVQAAEFLKNSDAKFFYFLSPQRREKNRLEARARMFFYGGEDPATGSAAGCAASWMVQHGIANSEEQVLIRQGVEIRRSSEMYVRATKDGERVTNVRVGGYAVEVLRGTMSLGRDGDKKIWFSNFRRKAGGLVYRKGAH